MSLIYARVSSKQQKGGVSLSFQVQECKRAATGSYKIVTEVHSAFRVVPPKLKEVTKAQNTRVVFYAVDRFSRDEKLGTRLAEKMLEKGCTLVFTREKLVLGLGRRGAVSRKDWRTFLRYLREGEAESEKISLRVKGSIRYLKENGYVSGPVPFGYTTKEVPDEKRLKLVEDEIEMSVLDFISLCATKGSSVLEINQALCTFAPIATEDPLVVEYEEVPVTHLKYRFTYQEIAEFLNLYGSTCRGAKWTADKVESLFAKLRNGKYAEKFVLSNEEVREEEARDKFERSLAEGSEKSDEEESDEEESDEEESDEEEESEEEESEDEEEYRQ
jgi:DNA invertase Pin-like site-specific DNA recombinase